MKKFLLWVVVAGFAAGCASPLPGGPVSRELVKSTRSWDGSLLPDYPRGRPEITILRIEIPAGAKLHLHHHPVINAGVLLSGRLKVETVDGRTLDLQAGDPLVEVMNTVHFGRNPGPGPAVILVFYAGVEGGPITVLDPEPGMDAPH